jgi:hypothetical protein
MRKLCMVRLMACALGLLTAGCRSGTPASPSSVLDGAWTGAITHSVAGQGSLVLELRQTGMAVSGTWSADFSGAAHDASGTVGGTLTGAAVSLFLSPGTPLVCGPGASLSGTLALDASVSGRRLSGTFVVFACEGVDSGRVEVTRAN